MWHGSTGDKVGPVLSAAAGLSVGLWTTANNAMAGDSQGVVSGLSDLAEIGKIVITITPAIRADVDVGGYIRATTVQVPPPAASIGARQRSASSLTVAPR